MRSSSRSTGAPCPIRHDLRPGDLGGILALHGAVYARECGYDFTFEGYVAQTLGRFARPYNTARERVWLAESDGQLVGCIGLIQDSEQQAHLRWFVVTPQMRGHGLGRTLLQEALHFAQDAGYDGVFLETVDELTAAAHLYRAMGFTKTSEQERVNWGKAVTEQRYELRFR